MGQFLDDTPTQEYQPKGKFIDLDSSQYNASDIMPYRKRENSGFMDKVKLMYSESSKSVQRGAFDTVGSMGGLFLSIIGDQLKVPEKDRAYLKEKYGYSDADIEKRFNAVGNMLRKWGEKTKYVYGDMVAQGDWLQGNDEINKGSFLENPSWTRAVSLGVGAIPSLGTAAITTIATGSPLLGIALLSGLEAEDVYSDSKERGESQGKSNVLFGATALGVGVLESAIGPLGKNIAGGGIKKGLINFVKNLTEGSIREGFTEGSQQLYENIVRKVGLDRTQQLLEGVVESIVAGAMSGGVLSSFSSKNIDSVVDEVKKEGITEDEINSLIDLTGEAVSENSDKIELEAQKQTEKTLKTIEKLEKDGVFLNEAIETEDIDGVKVAKRMSQSVNQNVFEIVKRQRVLEEDDLFMKGEVGFEDAKAIAKDYYFSNLFGKSSYSPALGKDVIYDEKGWEHTVGEDGTKRDDNNIVRRLRLLKKSKQVIENASVVESVRESLEKGKTFSLLGRFKDGEVVRVVVQEVKIGGKRFFSVFDVRDVTKKVQTVMKQSAQVDSSGESTKPNKSIQALSKKVNKIVEGIENKETKGRVKRIYENILSIDEEIDATLLDQEYRLNSNKPVKSVVKKLEKLFKDRNLLEQEKNSILQGAGVVENKDILIKKSDLERIKNQFLLNRSKSIELNVKQNTKKVKERIKDVQDDFISLIDESGIEAKDKAKFIKRIKNTQTKSDFEKNIKNINLKIQKLLDASKKNELDQKIKSSLKYTKPLKKGTQRVGKYDYESNVFFNEIRDYFNLNQSQALDKLNNLAEEYQGESDLVKRRILSLISNGKKSSVDMYEQVLSDIEFLKKSGELSKNEEDFFKKINRKDNVEKALEILSLKETDKDNIKTKIVNIYRRGFTNTYSMFNSMFGKDFAEKFDPEQKENRRETAIFEKTKETAQKGAEIFGYKDYKDLQSEISRMMSEKYFIKDNTIDSSYEITKMDLLDIYNSLKNNLTRERYFNAFGENQIKALMENINESEKLFADYMQEVAQSYREILNQRKIETTGLDLGEVENYWMATSEHQSEIFDDYRMQGETPSAMKSRVASKSVVPIPKNAWLKLMKHIAQAEHVNHLSREYESLRRMFNDRKLKHEIINKYGEDVYRTLLDQIENISLNVQTQKIDAVTGAFGFIINNWVTSKIALNPNVLAKQLISIGNYMENMDSKEWVKYFSEGLKNPKKTFRFMWNNAKFLEARFNRGYSEALTEVLRGSKEINKNKGKWAKFLSSWVRSGDITAIVFGGYPVIQSELAKGKSIEEAVSIFERQTLKAQQSGLKSGISQFQNSKNPFARLFLAFKNTPTQYFRKNIDALISYHNGDISKKQMAKVLAIYSVVQPALYAFVGKAMLSMYMALGDLFQGEEGDDDFIQEAFDSIWMQIAISPFSAIPLLDAMSNYSLRKITGKPAWDLFQFPFFDDFADGIKKMEKDNIDAFDFFEIIGSFLEPTTGTPIKTPVRIFRKILD